jgi:hypothetical protein
MSNRNTDDDFRFDDEDDLFRSNTFDDFDDNANLDDNLLDIGDEPIILDEDEAPPPREGVSRTFIILAVVLLVILVGGFGVLIVALLQGQGGSPELNITRTAIAERNATTIAQLATIEAQQTASFIETATARSFTATPSPTFTPSPTLTPEVDFTATALALIARQTEDAINANLTATALAVQIISTPTPEGALSPIEAANATATAIALGAIVTPIPVDAVNQTATALAILFDPIALTAQANANATAIAALEPTRPPSVITPPTQLPDTGLFDNLNANTMGALAVVALGLVGIIAFARRARSRA